MLGYSFEGRRQWNFGHPTHVSLGRRGHEDGCGCAVYAGQVVSSAEAGSGRGEGHIIKSQNLLLKICICTSDVIFMPLINRCMSLTSLRKVLQLRGETLSVQYMYMQAGIIIPAMHNEIADCEYILM